jgi:hypothetical protein
MAYIGQGIKEGTFTVLDTSGNTYNGSNVTFSLGTQVGSPAQLLVSHDGVIQKPGTDYSLATGGTQITFSTAPASGASIFITEISGAVGGPINGDLDGAELVLDTDGDTSITADTDDQIDIKIAGADDFAFKANKFEVQTGSNVDMNGTELILDADGDTSITADTDDQIDVKIAGADDFQFTANTFTVASGSKISGGGALTIDNASGDITIDAAGDILLDADDTDILLRDGGTTFGGFKQVSNGLQISGGTTPSIVADANGHVTMPAQTAFLVKVANDSAHQDIGTGTTDINMGTEIFDKNADYATSTFTAPVTGSYFFQLQVCLGDLKGDIRLLELSINCSNRSMRGNLINPDRDYSNNAQDYVTYNFSCLVDMDANDTATPRIARTSGTSGMDIIAGADSGPLSYLSGYLVA